MYNLFAILASNIVARIKLTAAGQKTVTSIFGAQRDELIDSDRERHPYAAGFTPSDGGVVEVAFKLPASLARLSPTLPNSMPELDAEEVAQCGAKAIVAVEAKEGAYCFQAIDSRSMLGPKRGVIFFGPDTNEVKTAPGIVFGAKLDAFYQEGTLYFVSEHVVRRFLDLDTLFREATNDDVRSCFSHTLFSGFDSKAVFEVADTWVRRKVTFINQSEILDKSTVKEFQTAAKLCGVGLQVKNNRIVVPTQKAELKRLLKFLAEDFLQSPIRAATIYEVSSKRLAS